MNNIYRWSGINSHGKKISGITQALGRKQLKANLSQQNILPLKIIRKFSYPFYAFHQITTKQINHLIEQLAVLINANTPIMKAFDIINQDEQNPKLKKLIINCKNSISDGKSLHQTLNQYPHYFNELLRNLINAGEQSGTLDLMLLEITRHIKKTDIQTHKIIKALLYPITVLSITVIVTIILLIFVIPQFETMFNNFGAKIPSYTRCIISISNLLQTTWHLILIILISLISGAKIAYRQLPKFHLLVDRLSLNLPLVKKIVAYTAIFRLTKTLGLTLKSGIPLLTAINIAITTIPNRHYQLAIQSSVKLIANGQTLHRSLAKQNLLPAKVIQLIMLGEETGTLDTMLEKIAAIYNEELNHLTDNLNNLLEPVIMLILGGLVGSVVIGMYLPIFRLGTII